MYHFRVDKLNARPIYLQIKDGLIAAIERGELRPGQKIPSARDLSDQMGVSRMTVLQAIRELTHQGKLFSVTGKGTFVGHAEKLEPNIRTVWGFTDTFRAEGYKTGSQLILFDVVNADAHAAEALQVSENTSLYRLARKRLLNDQPVGIETTHLVRSDVPGLEQFDWNKESLYTVLRQHYGLDPVCGRNYIEAAAADDITARLLSIPKNTPVLSTERITCLHNLHPVELVHSFYRADRMRLLVEMTSENPINMLSTKLEQVSKKEADSASHFLTA